MNTGSRLILVATRGESGEPIRQDSLLQVPRPADLHPDVCDTAALGPAFLMVRVKHTVRDIETIRQALIRHVASKDYLFHIIVSEDVPLDNQTLMLWGWFTRFDPLADLYPAGRTVVGNRLVFDFPIAIDARWKTGYPKPVEFDPEVEKRVAEKWDSLGLPKRK